MKTKDKKDSTALAIKKQANKIAKHNLAQSITIDTFSIKRSMGESSDWSRLGLKKKVIKDLNTIGYTGKLKKKQTNLYEYFENHIDTNKVKHKIEMVKSNGMEFTDTWLVTRVTIH